jgi:hypothetical protein
MRSPNRQHNRQSFFKYMSADTALKVLKNQSLRWSSPVLFNDPFDVPRELSFGITTDQLVQASGQRLIDLFNQPPEDTTGLTPKLRMIVDSVKRGISDELKAELLAVIREFVASHQPTSASMDELRNLWRARLPDHRILCLTENPSHTAMWHHYADKYRGVVLEFRCVDELDSAWLAARPVTYPLEKPAIYTADGWAKIMTLQHDAAIGAVLHTATYTKSPDWSYESEWRVATFKRPTDIGDFSDYGFNQRELGAMYFGPMISYNDRRSLNIASLAFPAAKLWNVGIGMSRESTFRAADI